MSSPEEEQIRTRLSSKEFVTSVTDAYQTKSPGLQLQARDYDILRFILEQKFCSLETVYFRFFDVRSEPSVSLPKNLWTTRQRLSKLRQSALIKTEKVLSSGKAHFLITPLGYKILTDKIKEVITIKPTKRIDFTLYEHDMRITMVRALLESKGKCKRWYSDKWLKGSAVFIDGRHKFHFAKDIRPDAFFINSKGEKIGFELELARKGRTRLQEKIRQYDHLIEKRRRFISFQEESREEFNVLDKVWFVVTKPAVARALRRAIDSTSEHPLCYRVDFYDEVVPEIARGSS